MAPQMQNLINLIKIRLAAATVPNRLTQTNKHTQGICVCLCMHKQLHALKTDESVCDVGKKVVASPCHHMGERGNKEKKKRNYSSKSQTPTVLLSKNH